MPKQEFLSPSHNEVVFARPVNVKTPSNQTAATAPAEATLPQAQSVTQVNELAKSAIEKNFAKVFVEGEVSKMSPAGAYKHWYFTIKDESSSMPVAFFNPPASQRQPQVGEKIIVAGRLSLYTKDARFQLIANKIYSTSAQGLMHEEYLRLYHKLRAAGVFDRTRELPKSFKSVGIITSASSAAMADMLRIRAELGDASTRVCVYDSLVQGPTAPAQLLAALKRADAAGHDVLLIARGGGSKEDLFCFNDEALAVAISRAKTPVIAAIGHEVDQHLADFAADLSLPTPTAAARRVFYDAAAREQEIDEYARKIKSLVDRKIERKSAHLKLQEAKLAKNPFKQYLSKLNGYEGALKRALKANLAAKTAWQKQAQTRVRSQVQWRLSSEQQRLQLATSALKPQAIRKMIDAMNLQLAAAQSRMNAARTNRLNAHSAHLARAAAVLAASEGFLNTMKKCFVITRDNAPLNSVQQLRAGDTVVISDALNDAVRKVAKVL